MVTAAKQFAPCCDDKTIDVDGWGNTMRRLLMAAFLGAGLGGGLVAWQLGGSRTTEVIAAGTDRYQDYILATGAVSLNARTQLDGVWLLDYRSGKLLGSCVDKTQGRMMPWAEVDLVSEFQVAPKQDVHFTMTTGYIAPGQSVLYIAETSTGQFGVYSMGPAPSGSGVVIRRHDQTNFRRAAETAAAPIIAPGAAAVPGNPAVPQPTPAEAMPAPTGTLPSATNPVTTNPTTTTPPGLPPIVPPPISTPR